MATSSQATQWGTVLDPQQLPLMQGGMLQQHRRPVKRQASELVVSNSELAHSYQLLQQLHAARAQQQPPRARSAQHQHQQQQQLVAVLSSLAAGAAEAQGGGGHRLPKRRASAPVLSAPGAAPPVLHTRVPHTGGPDCQCTDCLCARTDALCRRLAAGRGGGGGGAATTSGTMPSPAHSGGAPSPGITREHSHSPKMQPRPSSAELPPLAPGARPASSTSPSPTNSRQLPSPTRALAQQYHLWAQQQRQQAAAAGGQSAFVHAQGQSVAAAGNRGPAAPLSAKGSWPLREQMQGLSIEHASADHCSRPPDAVTARLLAAAAATGQQQRLGGGDAPVAAALLASTEYSPGGLPDNAAGAAAAASEDDCDAELEQMLSQIDWDLSAPAAAATAAAAAAAGGVGGLQHMQLLNARQQLLMQQQELQQQLQQLQQELHVQRVRSWGSGDATSSNCSMTVPALAAAWQALPAGAHPNTAAAAAVQEGDVDIYTCMAQQQAPSGSAQQQLGGYGAVTQHGVSACGGMPGANGCVQPAAAVPAAGALDLLLPDDDCVAKWLEGPLHEDERSLVDLLLN